MHVGVIAFGNALGNSIVSSLSKPPSLTAKEQADLERFSRISGQAASDKVNGVQTDANGVTTDALTRQLQQDSVNLGNAVGAEALTNVEKLNKVTPLRDTTRDVSGINALSAQSRLNIQNLEHQSAVNAQSRAETSIINAQRYADRTDAFRQKNPVYHAPAGIMDGVDVKGNLAWADQQRAKYEQSGIYAAELVYDAATNEESTLKVTFNFETASSEYKFYVDHEEAFFQYKNKGMVTTAKNIGEANFAHRTTWTYGEGISDKSFLEFDRVKGTGEVVSKMTRAPIKFKYSIGERVGYSSMHDQTSYPSTREQSANVGVKVGFKNFGGWINLEARTPINPNKG